LLHRNGFFPERLQQDSKPATISPPPPQKPRTILLYLLPSKKDGRRQIFQERVDEKENACGKELGRVQRNERVREKGKVDPFWRTPLLLIPSFRKKCVGNEIPPRFACTGGRRDSIPHGCQG